MNLTEQRYLDPAELAAYLGLKRKTVVDNAKALGGKKVLRRWRFKLEDVEAALGRSVTGETSAATPVAVDPMTPTPRSAVAQASKRRAAA